MNHDEVTARLPEYAAGHSGQARSRRVERHLADCQECRSWLETYRLLAEALRCQDQAPAELMAQYAVDPRELEADQRQRLDSHLAICSACRHELELTRRALARKDSKVRGRRAVVDRLAAHLSPHWRIALAASLLLAILLGGTMWLQRGSRHRPSDRIEGQELYGRAVIEAEGPLLIVHTRVGEGAEVSVTSQEFAALGEGFSVDSGASLEVRVAN